MKLRETLNLPLSARAAAAMYTDPAYAEIRKQTLGATRAEATADGDPAGAFTVRTELAMPTDRVPDVVRPFVGSSVTIHEVQTWSAPEADGSRSGTTKLEVAGTPAGMTASLRLTPAGEQASGVVIDGELTAKIPLLGSRLEKAAAPYVTKVLCAEEKSAAKYQASAAQTD
ncbi:DUF2505 domain-containing protein [Brachybacterium sp. GCM10030267]|uniref:DUF2505 domain-containing protein n=1 Tax=unclassified Brachybacterium TaxID=2623841 RepID=UPI00360A202B